WDLWLGPAPWRPFKAQWPEGEAVPNSRRGKGQVYHPFKWRGWQDFGTGALGDMACHTANMPFRALKLGYPTEIEAESSGMNKETYPKSSKIRFEFPAREGLKAVRFWWYDGGQKPDNDKAERVLDYIATTKDRDGKQRERKLPGSGCLL